MLSCYNVRQLNQQDKIESQKLNLYIYSQLTFDTDAQIVQFGKKKIVFLPNDDMTIICTCKNIHLDICYQLDSTWVIDKQTSKISRRKDTIMF